MALTKLMHMKQSGSRKPSRHLKNGIEYIMKENKTEGGQWIGGNAGSTPKEVYQAMLDTKEEYGKKSGRQGYHFVISFKEDASPEKVFEVMQEFCQEYLGENYDYVFTVHTDSAHIHAHVIFNSVSRLTGLKYHYKKGDWEKYIQPVTDRICMAHGFEKFEYEGGESRDYGEWKREQDGKRTWKRIVQDDIDRLIKEVASVDGLCKALVLAGYKIRQGDSKKHGRYIAFTPTGGEKAVRSYQLSKGYNLQDIERRIKDKDGLTQVDRAARIPRVKSSAFSKEGLPAGETAFYPSAYQYYYIRRYCQNTVLYQYQNTRCYSDIRETEELARCCRYLIRNNIRSEKAVQERWEQLEARQASLDAERTHFYQTNLSKDETEALKRYENLQAACAAAEKEGRDDDWEALADEMNRLQEKYPLEALQQKEQERRTKLSRLREENAALRNEKRTLAQISAQRGRRNKEVADDWSTVKKRL